MNDLSFTVIKKFSQLKFLNRFSDSIQVFKEGLYRVEDLFKIYKSRIEGNVILFIDDLLFCILY